ncbi:hypothetical protein GCM10010869_47890 [Mesorhizobium tianshanense]|uniref:Uncharacterized protein n=1 Tax=Mesorhizobium tianshanense TaxID=39844 RepID=A0A562NSU4_9HYPH|nr:hypothetical protein [Mesorhizobium tianshanense]TWI35287.1 hypothetical protein IQ26_03267 [Mesorhizobium tianshanense]GLS39192.1 hypothetical protein GCM10010869_47890 [Mesorhizobium tianshanense]
MSSDIPAPPSAQNYLPDQIMLYGVRLNFDNLGKVSHRTATLPLNENLLRMSIVKKRDDVEPIIPTKEVIAIVYGYAFEGQCYRNDKPKLLIFHPTTGETAATGCGFDDLGYVMWGVTKKTPIMELATSTDFAEEIILNANLPGNRSPNTYGNSFMLAHRGGRLSRGGGSQS